MITVISGTNRNDANTLKIAQIAQKRLEKMGQETQMCDLNKLPKGLFEAENYWNVPDSFKPFQDMISNTDGILLVVPEYNGSFPGALKYFIDLLKFPESLAGIPSSFVGVAAGIFGAIRSIEQIEMVFQYRNAHIYGARTLFMGIEKKLNDDKTEITDEFTSKKLDEQLEGFVDFVTKLKK